MDNDSTTMNDKVIRRAILEVVAFFDIFDYPLSQFEIWQYLKIKCDLEAVVIALSAIEQLSEKNGFYFLRGREETVTIRMRRYNIADRKFKRALFVSRIFKWVPWVRMIAVGNVMGANNMKENSDIDFFVVTDRQRVWITRFFCVGVIKILNLRPQPDNQKDKICLSFFVGDDNLDLSKLMLAPAPEPDIYFIYWLSGLTPIFDRDQAYPYFLSQNNWLSRSLPNWKPLKMSYLRTIKPMSSNVYRDIADIFLGELDSNLHSLQMRLLPNEIKDIMNNDSRVVVKNGIIKTHVNDRRTEYRNQWKLTCAMLNK